MAKRKRKQRSDKTQEEQQSAKRKIKTTQIPTTTDEQVMIWSSASIAPPTANDSASIKQDDGVEQYFDLANAPHVAYRCQQDKYSVRVKQNASIEDSTGGIVWESAYLVSAFLDTNREKWLQTPETRSVLEVGAGCGLLGLTIAHITAGSGTHVVLTETPPVTDLLNQNVEAEIINHKKAFPKVSHSVQAEQLIWGNESDIQHLKQIGTNKAGTFDPFHLVVGTDVVFTHSLVIPLLDTLHQLTGSTSQVLLGMQVRCAKAHAMLFRHAPRYFEVEVMTEDFEGTCAGANAVECGLYRFHSRRDVVLPESTLVDFCDGADDE